MAGRRAVDRGGGGAKQKGNAELTEGTINNNKPKEAGHNGMNEWMDRLIDHHPAENMHTHKSKSIPFIHSFAFLCLVCRRRSPLIVCICVLPFLRILLLHKYYCEPEPIHINKNSFTLPPIPTIPHQSSPTHDSRHSRKAMCKKRLIAPIGRLLCALCLPPFHACQTPNQHGANRAQVAGRAAQTIIIIICTYIPYNYIPIITILFLLLLAIAIHSRQANMQDGWMGGNANSPNFSSHTHFPCCFLAIHFPCLHVNNQL